MGFSRQEDWSGLPFPSPGDLPDPGIEPRSSTLQVDSLLSEPPEKPQFGGKLSYFTNLHQILVIYTYSEIQSVAFFFFFSEFL